GYRPRRGAPGAARTRRAPPRPAQCEGPLLPPVQHLRRGHVLRRSADRPGWQAVPALDVADERSHDQQVLAPAVIRALSVAAALTFTPAPAGRRGCSRATGRRSVRTAATSSSPRRPGT